VSMYNSSLTSHLVVRDDGTVILTRKEKLEPKQVLRMQNKLRSAIGLLTENNIEMAREIQRNDVKILSLQNELAVLESKEVKEYLERERELAELAIKKADNLLREYIGEDAYRTLKSGKSIVFTARDGVEYKLNPQGEVGRKVGSKYKRMCVVNPVNIPLDDRVIAIITSVRENPTRFQVRGNREVN